MIDTPPLENFYKELNNFLYFVQGIIFLFDGANKNSYLRMIDYFKKIKFYNFQKVGIIATKKDICKENKKYKFHQLKRFCKENNAIPFFISVKKSKKEIYDFINLLCPKIIPSLVNKKKEIKLEYPYTKTIKNNYPKENYLDKAILQKLKNDDSSYESEKEEDSKNKKNRDEIIKEYILKKEMEKNQIKKKKINTLFSVGKINEKIHENDEEYLKQSFNDVIGNVNLDMEKLFKKYRPDSDKKSNKKNKNKNQNKNIDKDGNIKIIDDKNVKDNDEWVDVNMDDMVNKFMKTKDDFNKKIERYNEKMKEKEKEEKKDNNEQKAEEEKSEIKEENKKEEENEKSEEEKDNKGEEKVEEEEKNEKEENEKNEEEEKEEDKNEEEEKEEEKEENDTNKKKGDEDLDDDNYDDLSNDIYEFKQSLMSEARRQHELK